MFSWSNVRVWSSVSVSVSVPVSVSVSLCDVGTKGSWTICGVQMSVDAGMPPSSRCA